MTVLLAVDGLNAWYGHSHILQGVSFEVGEGQVVALLGRNGAGKTTTLKTVMGLVPQRQGSVRFAGMAIERLPSYRVARAGIAYVPETRGIFPSLSVLENLTLAARPSGGWTLERVFALFPRLAERRGSGGGQLSGGEQQMLAIARALLANARLLILDEPTEGLAPMIVAEIQACLAAIRRDGCTMLLVEQNLAFATELADELLVLGRGRIRWHGTSADFAAADEVKQNWLGV